MNDDWKDQYIYLQRCLIDALRRQNKGSGRSMEVIEAIERLEEYEDSLPWNKEQAP